MNSRISLIQPEFCRRHLVQTIVLLAFCTQCAAACMAKPLKTAEITIKRAGLEPVIVKVELARTEKEREQGLMFRKRLEDGRGMLFIFESDQRLSFWMKNTLIPLSIAFIASDGRIIEIRDMQPHDLRSVRSSRSVRYALEVPQGWFTRAGIKAGDIAGIDNVPLL